MNNHLVSLKDISKIYKMGVTQLQALKRINLEINPGDFLAVMGPSGSGKSTLMNIIGCLDKPTSGEYFLEGIEISKYNKNQLAVIRNQKIGFVFQTFNLLPRTTAIENVELPLLYTKISSKKRREMAYRVLAQVGLEGRENQRTNQLSGGEQQRVAIARALINNPTLLLADEPTGNLDSKTGDEILNIFRSLNQERNITVVIVTHDPHVAEMAKRIIFLKDGEIIDEKINQK
jgi:putative ABC transport system ATP-binding protein